MFVADQFIFYTGAADKAQEVRQNRMLAANLQKMRPKTALPVWTPKGFKVPAPTKQAL
jgi:hypothetical protein